MNLTTKDFYYDLPQELIAAHPLKKREQARMMVLNRERKTTEHKYFYDIINYLNKDDVLVLNNTKFSPQESLQNARQAERLRFFF